MQSYTQPKGRKACWEDVQLGRRVTTVIMRMYTTSCPGGQRLGHKRAVEQLETETWPDLCEETVDQGPFEHCLTSRCCFQALPSKVSLFLRIHSSGCWFT